MLEHAPAEYQLSTVHDSIYQGCIVSETANRFSALILMTATINLGSSDFYELLM
ncbi:MAG: hypothetical protein ACJ75J_18630 [Cytophagaceae bacterium]